MTNISDEMLSAYLDKELNPEEMAKVKDAVARNPELGQRLSLLSGIDVRIRQQAQTMDARKVPQSLLDLLEQKGTSHRSDNNLNTANFWQGSAAFFSRQKAITASLTLVIGLFIGYSLQSGLPTDASPSLENYSDTLSSANSGTNIILDNGYNLLNRFTFQDDAGRYCRQYQVQNDELNSENVACFDNGQWVLIASLQIPTASDALTYRPASGPALLDGLLNDLMQGPALSLEAERNLINQNWQVNE